MAKGGMESLRRCVKTVFFMVAMMASLIALCAPVIVATGDVMAQCVLISSFTCVRCYSFQEHFQRYGFKSSLIDIPLVSAARSLIIACVYLMCDDLGLYHGPYLGTITLCSCVSLLVLSVKACMFTFNYGFEGEASSSLSRKRLHLKKSWGMPVLFLCSVVFALGHTVVAYRTSCRARRKLLHRIDPETVFCCTNFFSSSSFQELPRSPIPTCGRAPKSDGGMMCWPLVHGEGQVPAGLLADADSLFTSCQGLTLHYKLCMHASAAHFSSPTRLVEPRLCSFSTQSLGRLRPERPSLPDLLKNQYHFSRSFSNQFQNSSLYVPLLESQTTYPDSSEETPLFDIDGASDEDQIQSTNPEKDIERNEQTAVVFVHGFGGGVFSWRHVIGLLAPQIGCTVAAFDRPGWGLTTRPRKQDWEEKQMPNPYKLESQVELLLSFCVDMGFSSVVLVGHDDGGLLVMKAALRAAKSVNHVNVAVKGIVLVSVGLSRGVVPAFARILLHTSLGKKHLVRPLLRTEISQVVNRHAWYDAAKLTPEVASLYKAPLFVEGWDEALHEIGKLSYETVVLPQDGVALLKSLGGLPVLVVAGVEDALVPVEDAQAMASQLVNSRLVTVSGCGHLPHEECPQALVAMMSHFICRLITQPDLESQ